MRVAVTVFESRVSPRFDCATGVLVTTVADGTVGEPELVPVDGSNPLTRVARLRELGVEAVVCGAVTGFELRQLAANGIEVLPWVCCDAETALAALARGELVAGLPQRGRCRRGQRRGRCGRNWESEGQPPRRALAQEE